MLNLPNYPCNNDKRMDALLREQMTEYKAVINSHHKEMQELRDSLKLAMDRFDSLYEKSEVESKHMALSLTQQITFLKEKVIANEVIISEQKKSIESLHNQINEFYLVFASKIDLEKLKKAFEIEIKANTISHINSFQEFQREFKSLIHIIKSDVLRLKCDVEEKFTGLKEKFEVSETLFCLDKEGVLKEVRIWEKSIFVIEKKIENLYTLIERINNRSAPCHKPE